MLNVYLGDMEGVIYNPPLYFKNSYDETWITDNLSREMIRDVDRSEVISGRVIDSPVLGGITPRELSGGVKTLICIYREKDMIFNASACGDNCAKWLLRIGGLYDVTINLRHLMDFGDEEFTIHILNTDKMVHDMKAFLFEAMNYVG